MNCESVINIEDLFTEGRLSPSRRGQVHAHIDNCAACAARLKSVSPFAGLKGASAPKDLKERMKRMLEKIGTSKPEPQRRAFSVDNEIWPVAASIAIYLGLALLLAWVSPGVPSEKYDKTTGQIEVSQ